ncbi:DUF5994 family protein [Nocardioides sp. Soil805]|uniref:DUF5994 family protein n=1 Tax=Nocardioides sp. Soil805 TaxID=1736416 RepID=UPI000702535B|nr:DUF5994 family protein [Nocardioides sp. Soil805]KRF35136.1 hypothetical protein ASG94_13520 [Nocardioides sp. Soil805]
MSTPPSPLPATPAAAGGPLRLRLVDGRPGQLDGGWWPRSRDLAIEVADLAEQLPAHLGPILRVQCSGPDWDGDVDRILVGDRTVVVVSRTHDHEHHVDLTTDRSTLRLLVVPPGFNDADGEEALLAAATPGNAHSAGDLLRAVTDEDDVDPRDRWRDDGTAGWGGAAAASSPRPAGR